MSRLNVTIVGAGIGGLAAAAALKQRGIACSVYESSPLLRAQGAGIWMSPNAMQMLARLGLADAVRSGSVEMQRIEVLDARMRPLQVMELSAIKQKRGFSIHAIRRQSLHEILASPVGGIVMTGRRLEEFEQTSSGVTARFAGGDSVQSDVLIGADGLRSRVRYGLFPSRALRYAGQTCWYGLSSCRLPARFGAQTTEVWLGRLRVGFTTVDGDETYFFALQSGPKSEIAEDAARRFETLQSAVSEAPAIVREIIAGSSPGRVIQADLHDMVPGRFVSGRVALLGDAAHATTPNMGQGAAQALESALAVADLLAGHGDPALALSAYEAARRKRTAFITNQSFRIGRVAHSTGIRARLLHAMMRIVPAQVQQWQMNRVFEPTTIS